MPSPRIFLSYRRDDAAGYARALCDELAQRFGAEAVFIDVDDIGAGQPFGTVIQQAMAESKVLLVLIGKRWRGEREGGPARLDDADDPVRLEVAAGLAQGMSVIPLLFDGAAMPGAAQLPEPLRALAQRNALEIGNTRFAADVERLVVALRQTLGEPGPALAGPPTSPATDASGRGHPRRTPWWLALTGLLLVAAVAATWVRRGPPPGTGTSPSAASVGTASPPAASARTARLALDGAWQAEVTYDWPNARFIERFVFAGEGSELHGSASFLGVPRGVLEGRVEPGGLRFVTRTREDGADTVHRYTGRLVGEEIRFMMQTEGGASTHVPVEFSARRALPAEPAASR